jgi:gliding motility-associated-like protein
MRLLNIILLFLTLNVYSQYCPSLGSDQYLPCGVNSTTLTADLSQCGPGGANPNQTTNYGVTNIPYVAQTNTGTQLFMSDDSQQGPFNIGFTFCFFGQTYTQFYVGSNGWISFSAGQSVTFTSQPIPNVAPTIPKNCIMGPWQDWHPGLGGQIRYQVQGVAPCRKLVVSWVGVPMFSCTNNQGTFHIVIYESTNIIENHIANKPACLQWQNGTATQGVHNLAGTIGITVPGRNSTAWTTSNNSYRYTPSGPTVTPTLTWFRVGNPNPIGTGPTITVTPPPAGANYTCQFVYPTCNAGWSTCNAGIGNLGPDTVFVQPGPPNLPPPIITTTNPTCFQYCDGIVDVSPVGGSGIQTISWNGGLPNNFIVNSLCSGNYSFTIVDANGCTVSGNATLVDPPIVTINPIIGSDTVCYNSTSNPYNVTSTFPNLDYVWTTTIGNITTGQGTGQINLDVTGVNGGLYNNTLSVIGVSQLGCESQPQTFTIVDLNILPVIAPVGPFCEYDNCITLNGTPIGGLFIGNNVTNNQYCPDLGFVGQDTIYYDYIQSGCFFDTSIVLDVFPRPIVIPSVNNLIDEYTVYHEICEGDTISDIFSSVVSNNGFNQWIVFGDTLLGSNISLTWDQEGTFNFQVIRWENGCESYPQNFTATIELCPQELIFIPNTFTPDGDENNNEWVPVFTSGFDPYRFELLIFNRWGQLIWESHNPYSKWDGTYNGMKCQDGIYFWTVTYGVEKTDERKQIQGHLTIIR